MFNVILSKVSWTIKAEKDKGNDVTKGYYKGTKAEIQIEDKVRHLLTQDFKKVQGCIYLPNHFATSRM